MQPFLLTPESITALVQVLLAVLIAGYIFSRRNKSRVLLLLGLSLIGETIHHLIKFIAFSSPDLYQSATPLLGISSLFIFVILAIFAYEFRERLYPREGTIVGTVLGTIALAISALLLYVFFSAKPHDQIAGSEFMLYGSLTFLILTVSWAIVVLLRKAWYFKHQTDTSSPTNSPQLSRYRTVPAQACIAFALIFSIKIFIIFASFLSAVDVMPVGFRIYVNLILHIFYLSALTVVIIDHIQHPTSLQIKLIGLTLVSVLLILSIAGLSVYNTQSLLEQSEQFVSNRHALRFSPAQDQYEVSRHPYERTAQSFESHLFGDDDNLEIALKFSFPFGGHSYGRVFINRNGLISFDEPYALASKPVFFMDQLSPPYNSKLHFTAYGSSGFVAPLLVRMAPHAEAEILVAEDSSKITFRWANLNPASEEQPPIERREAFFESRLYRNGRIEFTYGLESLYLYEGLVGIYTGQAAEMASFSPIVDSRFASTSGPGLIFDLGATFRSFVHREVTPLAWIILGSIAFVVLLFPLAFRSSLFKPLNALLDGVRRVDQGTLDKPVPITGPDEIGDVTKGFNAMMASLRTAHEQLLRHAGQLEEEVVLRTEEIRQQKEVLEEQAARLRELDEMKSRFFANISHEFRTPLNLIMGPLQSILDGQYGKVDEQLTYRHQVMLHESKRLLRLINQMLDLSKLEAGRMTLDFESIDLVSLLRRIVHSFFSRAEIEDKQLSFASQATTLSANVDPRKIEDIGYNLIDNALKFTEKGGKVRVSLAVGDADTAVITVQDTGQGIPAADLDLIFDRFQQVRSKTDDRPPGTGIGLALVQELVFLHEGTIDVASEPGFGSTFTIKLPIEPAQSITPDDRLDVSHAASNGASIEESLYSVEVPAVSQPDDRQTVLVVDDDIEFRQFIKECLQDTYAVREAENGRAGLDAARTNTPHLIVADLMMPEMDGIAFCLAAKRDPDLDHIPFILLTAKTSTESRIEGLEQGADAYLSKPIDPRELRTQIQNLLDQRKRLVEKYSDLVRLEPAHVTVESADAALLKQIREVIDEHLSDSTFSVTLLADELGMSTRDLQRKLRKLLDIGPKELMTNLRIERAKLLLGARAGTVSQIAYKVGFNRPEHFMRTFKQHTGQTPGQFMKGDG